MGKAYLRKVKKDEVTVMGEKIQVRSLSFGETRESIGEATTQKGKQVIMDQTAVGVLRVLKAIVSWELEDENGNILPIELNTLDNILDENFVGELVVKVNEFLDGEAVTDEEKK